MFSFDLLVAILTLALAVWLTWFLCKCLFSSFLGFSSSKAAQSVSPVSGSSKKPSAHSQKHLKKYQSQLSKADTSIEKGDLEGAIKSLKQAFALKLVPKAEVFSETIRHNELVLGSVLRLAEKNNRRIGNISIVEQLLTERGECETELVNAEIAYEKLLKRRSESGKNVPAWGKKEFQQKIKSLKNDRKANLSTLDKQLTEMFVSLVSEDDSQVTYH